MTLLEALKVKPGLSWRPQDVGDATVLRYLRRKTANREWSQTIREMCVTVNKAEKSWRSAESVFISQGDTKFEFAQLFVGLDLVEHFLFMPLFHTFRMVICILCHYKLAACDLFFQFVFFKGLYLRDCMSPRKDFEPVRILIGCWNF